MRPSSTGEGDDTANCEWMGESNVLSNRFESACARLRDGGANATSNCSNLVMLDSVVRLTRLVGEWGERSCVDERENCLKSE